MHRAENSEYKNGGFGGEGDLGITGYRVKEGQRLDLDRKCFLGGLQDSQNWVLA